MTTISIQGFGPNDKVPGAVSKVTYGAGNPSPGTATFNVLLVAPQAHTPGTATNDTEIFRVLSENDAIVKTGSGSEFHRAAQKLLRRKVSIYGLCPSIESGAQATLVVTVAGTWTSAGSWALRIDGTTVSGGIGKAQTKAEVAAAITAAINGKLALPVSATQGTSTNNDKVTLTWKTDGARGNRAILWIVSDDLPTGCTMSATGTAATGGGVYFASGAGVEDVSDALTTIAAHAKWFFFIAAAQHDTTNLGRWKTWLDSQAAPFVEKPSFLVFGTNASLSTAGSLASTTCNNPFMQCMWMLNGESHPTSLAAAMAALRCESVQTVGNAAFDDEELLDIAGITSLGSADIPDRATKQAALDEGVTPVYTDGNGVARVTRSINTFCLVSGAPYYGTLDTYEAEVPQLMRIRYKARWQAFKAVNPYLRGEPSQSEPTPPEGVATPTRWNAEIIAVNNQAATDRLLTETATYLPRTEFDSVANRFMSECPNKVLKHQHQIGISVLQIAS